jgi:hypothetical protein
MNDLHDDDELREPTPEEEAEISRLLAEAGGPVAVPDEVAARLDATLAALVEERRDEEVDPPAAPVVPLAERRARRRWPRLVLAAAAVVVAGYAVGTAVTDSSLSGSDAESATAGDAAGAGEADGGGARDEAGPQDNAVPEATADRDAARRLAADAVRLRSDTLADDITAALADRRLGLSSDEDGLSELRAQSTRKSAGCAAPALDQGQRWLPARYDGVRAVLVTGPPADGSLPAEVRGCDGELLDSAVVDLR